MNVREETAVFRGRAHAAQELAKLIDRKYKLYNPLILGVPRGGIEIAYYVAAQLQTDFEVIISKKLPYPGHEEYGFGAVAEDGTIYVAEGRSQRLSSATTERLVDQQLEEIKQR